jgi:hypothetical protein
MTLLGRILHSESTTGSGWEHRDLSSGASVAGTVVVVVGQSSDPHLYDSALVVDQDEPMKMLTLANGYELSATYGEYPDDFESDPDFDDDSIVFTMRDSLDDTGQ